MSTLITVVPASTRAGRETIRCLLGSSNPPTVRAVYRDVTKAPVEFSGNPHFEAVHGDVKTDNSLDFSGSNAVLYVPPSTLDGSDQGDFATKTAQHVSKALEKAKVRRLVLHSSLAAQFSHSTGILRINHITDNMLKHSVPEVIIVKPAWYFEMWDGALQTMQTEQPYFESPFSPPDFSTHQVGVRDIGEYCARALLEESIKSSPHYVDVLGPREYSSLDIKKAIEEVTGKEGTLITIPRGSLAEYWIKKMPKEYASELVDMTTALLPGGVAHRNPGFGGHIVRGKMEPVDAFRLLASQ